MMIFTKFFMRLICYKAHSEGIFNSDNFQIYVKCICKATFKKFVTNKMSFANIKFIATLNKKN